MSDYEEEHQASREDHGVQRNVTNAELMLCFKREIRHRIGLYWDDIQQPLRKIIEEIDLTDSKIGELNRKLRLLERKEVAILLMSHSRLSLTSV